MKLQDTSVLITGAGRGIGRFLAENLVSSVTKVIVIDKDPELLKTIPAGSNLFRYQCDLTSAEATEKVINEIFADHPEINVCINNAGLIHNELLVNSMERPFKKHNIQTWQRVIDINLNAVFYVATNIAAKMIAAKQPGLILNISSISAKGNTGQSAYAASKAAVEALTVTWAKELGMHNIRCACIAPGFFDTPSTKENLSEAMMQKWQRSVPVNRLGTLSELLSAVEFIIGNDYFNGKTLSVDGGLTL